MLMSPAKVDVAAMLLLEETHAALLLSLKVKGG